MTRPVFAAAALAALIIGTTASAQPQSFSNSIKYSDTSIRNASGRSGSAAIEARALLNRDDSADVEVTTGSFESTDPAPGTISRVQIKIPTGGEPITKNYAGLDAGGTFSTNVSGLAGVETIGIQAWVRDIDPSRTDVVSVQETVKKRPDLTVYAVSPPGQAVTGVENTVRGYIRELNGDVGARATCRLLVNGVEADRAENIWVDAGGSIACVFSTVLQVEGPVEWKVVVDDVDPGDWDESNNSNTYDDFAHNVLDEFYSWTATATENEFDTYSYTNRGWREETRQDKGVEQIFRFQGAIFAAVSLESVLANLSAQSDGNPLFEASATDFYVFDTPVGSRCASSFSSNPNVEVCFQPDYNTVRVDISYATADAVYRSWGWATKRNPFAPTEPMFTWNDTRETNTLQSRFGSTVAMSFQIADGTNQWTAEPFLPSLTTTVKSTNVPYRCRFDSFTGDTICGESRSTTTTKRGTTSGFAD